MINVWQLICALLYATLHTALNVFSIHNVHSPQGRYIPLVILKMLFLNMVSVQPNRLAISGKYLPNWSDCRLVHDGLSSGKQYLAIGNKASCCDGLTRFGQVNLSLRNDDGRTDVEALVEVASVNFSGELFVVYWQ